MAARAAATTASNIMFLVEYNREDKCIGMKIVINGVAAAGNSTAVKAIRNVEDGQVTIYETDEHTSCPGSGLPYYIGDEVEDIGELIPKVAAFFKSKYNSKQPHRHV